MKKNSDMKWVETSANVLSIIIDLILFHLSVTVQKVESQNGGNKKTKQAKFSEKLLFLTPWYVTYVCVSGGKKCYLRFEIHLFALLPTL